MVWGGRRTTEGTQQDKKYSIIIKKNSTKGISGFHEDQGTDEQTEENNSLQDSSIQYK